LKRAWSLEAQEDAVLHVLTRLYNRPGRLATPAPAPLGSAKIVICVAETPEATSAGFILQQMVQRNLQIFTFLVRQPSQVSIATCALVILSQGILTDANFAQTLLALRKAHASIVPINDGSFYFPAMAFYADVEEGNVVLDLPPNLGPAIARAYQELLSILALPFTPLGSIGLLERQVHQICQRFGSSEDVEERLTSKSVYSERSERSERNNQNEEGEEGAEIWSQDGTNSDQIQEDPGEGQ